MGGVESVVGAVARSAGAFQTREAALGWCSAGQWERTFPEENAALRVSRAGSWLTEHAQEITPELGAEEVRRVHEWSRDWQNAYSTLRHLERFIGMDSVASVLGHSSLTQELFPPELLADLNSRPGASLSRSQTYSLYGGSAAAIASLSEREQMLAIAELLRLGAELAAP